MFKILFILLLSPQLLAAPLEAKYDYRIDGQSYKYSIFLSDNLLVVKSGSKVTHLHKTCPGLKRICRYELKTKSKKILADNKVNPFEKQPFIDGMKRDGKKVSFKSKHNYLLTKKQKKLLSSFYDYFALPTNQDKFYSTVITDDYQDILLDVKVVSIDTIKKVNRNIEDEELFTTFVCVSKVTCKKLAL